MSILETLTKIDCDKVTKNILEFISKNVAESKMSGVVLGLSGGLDSAVCAILCAKACDTLAMIMPDTKITPRFETDDALRVAKLLGMDTKVIDIAPIVTEFTQHITDNDAALGNIRSRIRMTLLYNHANITNTMVAGTSDKSESLIGYFTKYGDGAADIFPISTLYKIQVRQMAKFLDIPSEIIQKKSAPHLWNNRNAEDELGLDYEEIDPILHCIVDENMNDENIAKSTLLNIAKIAHVRKLYESSSHKRSTPRGMK